MTYHHGYGDDDAINEGDVDDGEPPKVWQPKFTKMMMMGVLVKTFPEQSLQDIPPVPRHLWQAFTTPVCGTVTTRT